MASIELTDLTRRLPLRRLLHKSYGRYRHSRIDHEYGFDATQSDAPDKGVDLESFWTPEGGPHDAHPS